MLNGARIHILGVAYKKDIDDVRESPALDIMHLLMRRGAQVAYTDPYVPSVKVDGRTLSSQDLDGALTSCDCAVIITDHGSVDYPLVVEKAPLVVDTRNALKGFSSEKIVRL